MSPRRSASSPRGRPRPSARHNFRLVGVEVLSEAELGRLHDRNLDLPTASIGRETPTKACSVEESAKHGHAAAARGRMAQAAS